MTKNTDKIGKMKKINNIFNMEKKSVFLINFFLVMLIIIFFLFNLKIEYFFYFDLIITLILSYFFFKRSKKLAETLIITNLFIFFYFLYPKIAIFLNELLGINSYIFIIFYNILISYLFIYLSGNHKSFLGNLKKFNFKIFFIIIIIGIFLGFLFYFIKEPIPELFANLMQTGDLKNILIFLTFNSFIVALSEQMIFSGFLFNTYKKLTSKFDAIFQVSIIFVLFHLLRFEILIKYYFTNFNDLFVIYLIFYYVLLFIFMNLALYFYSFKSKKYEGNFIYPLTIHFITDFSLFILYFLSL